MDREENLAVPRVVLRFRREYARKLVQRNKLNLNISIMRPVFPGRYSLECPRSRKLWSKKSRGFNKEKVLENLMEIVISVRKGKFNLLQDLTMAGMYQRVYPR